jgi:hypothetical protein
VTDVRQRAEPAGPPAVRPSLVLHGGLVAVAAAVSGLAVLSAIVLVAWVADAGPGSSGADAVRAAADAWLLAHGGGLTVAAGHVRAIPLGLTLLAAIVLHRAGASLARAVDVAGLRDAVRATAALAVPYGLLAAAVAKLAATGTATASAVAAGTGALLLAAVFGGRGVLRAADLFPALRRRVPSGLPAVVRSALSGLGALFGAGLLVLLVALFWHAARFASLTGSLRPGIVGGVVLVLGLLLLLPNGALWAVAYAAGPGFTVGAGTGVSPFGATLGPVPALPLLAALPGDGTPAPAVRAVLLLPVLAGVLAGWELSRRLPPGIASSRLPAMLGGRAARSGAYGLVVGGVVALVGALLAALAGGALGPGYLAAVGPSAWQVALALAIEVGIPAGLTAAILPSRHPAALRTPYPTPPRPAPPTPAAPRPDKVGPNAARPDKSGPDKSGPDSGRPDEAGRNAGRPDGRGPDGADAARSETTGSDAARSEAGRGESEADAADVPESADLPEEGDAADGDQIYWGS